MDDGWCGYELDAICGLESGHGQSTNGLVMESRWIDAQCEVNGGSMGEAYESFILSKFTRTELISSR
jgi:hypothetical protein